MKTMISYNLAPTRIANVIKNKQTNNQTDNTKVGEAPVILHIVAESARW